MKNGLLYFSATWCGPCRVFKPVMQSLENVAVQFVDVDRDQEFVNQYGVKSVPTVIAIVDGEPKDKIMGARSKAEMELFVENNFMHRELDA